MEDFERETGELSFKDCVDVIRRRGGAEEFERET